MVFLITTVAKIDGSVECRCFHFKIEGIPTEDVPDVMKAGLVTFLKRLLNKAVDVQIISVSITKI